MDVGGFTTDARRLERTLMDGHGRQARGLQVVGGEYADDRTT
jgi:hypothetical protein